MEQSTFFEVHLRSAAELRRTFLWNSSTFRTPAVMSKVLITATARVSRGNGEGEGFPRGVAMEAKRKDNVWSVDNELYDREASLVEKTSSLSRRRRRGRRVRTPGRKVKDPRVLVSAAMLIDIETVLQTQEPVIKPVWNTFSSSVCGIWKGVGAVFSPFTAEMEPIAIGKKNENLYDCYTLSCIDKVSSLEVGNPEIRRKTNWVNFNPFGEKGKHSVGGGLDFTPVEAQESSDADEVSQYLPSFKTFDFGTSEVLEEDIMGKEPGLVFFEDGSYSRGPVYIPIGEYDESRYFLSPTFKFEQCLVKGCHKRLRIVHTIEFNEGGSSIQIVRVALFEEQWISPVNLDDNDDMQFDVVPFSQRRRTRASDLSGTWKVFEMSATPIFVEEEDDGTDGPPFVYFCTETLKNRSLPENTAAGFGEEEILDMQDVAVLWLPGGVTGYVDVNKEGVLCLGVGWYSDEGVNLVMERDYDIDGKLKEVRWKSEVKRRWNQHPITS